jgi:hypothetical protein
MSQALSLPSSNCFLNSVPSKPHLKLAERAPRTCCLLFNLPNSYNNCIHFHNNSTSYYSTYPDVNTL